MATRIILHPQVFQNEVNVTGALSLSGVSLSETLSNKAPLSKSVKAISSLTYTLSASDSGTIISYNNGSNSTVTIPSNVLSVGSEIEFIQLGAGKLVFSAAVGVTLYGLGGANKTSAQYAAATLRQLSTNVWILAGNISV